MKLNQLTHRDISGRRKTRRAKSDIEFQFTVTPKNVTCITLKKILRKKTEGNNGFNLILERTSKECMFKLVNFPLTLHRKTSNYL